MAEAAVVADEHALQRFYCHMCNIKFESCTTVKQPNLLQNHSQNSYFPLYCRRSAVHDAPTASSSSWRHAASTPSPRHSIPTSRTRRCSMYTSGTYRRGNRVQFCADAFQMLNLSHLNFLLPDVRPTGRIRHGADATRRAAGGGRCANCNTIHTKNSNISQTNADKSKIFPLNYQEFNFLSL